MKKLLTNLLISALTFLPLNAQKVALLKNDSFNFISPKLELNIDNRKDLINSQGFFRANVKDVNFYIDRYGLLNAGAGFESGNAFFNLDQKRTRISNRAPGLTSTLDNTNQSYDVGFVLPSYTGLRNGVGIERANSRLDIDSKIVYVMGDTLISRLSGLINQTSNQIIFRNKYGYIKAILNELDSKTIDQKSDGTAEVTNISHSDFKNIFSFSPIPQINYTYDGEDHAYITNYSDGINAFLDINTTKPGESRLVIESGNLKNYEIRDFERKIENNNRSVDRIQDLTYETGRKVIENMFYKRSFRWEMQKGKKDNFRMNNSLNFKYFNLHTDISTNNSPNIAISLTDLDLKTQKRKYYLGSFMIGKKDKEIYVGYRRND